MWKAQTYVKRQNFWEKCILSNCQYSRKVHYVIKVHINEFTKSNGRNEFRNIIWWDIGGEDKFKPFFFSKGKLYACTRQDNCSKVYSIGNAAEPDSYEQSKTEWSNHVICENKMKLDVLLIEYLLFPLIFFMTGIIWSKFQKKKNISYQ